MTVCPCHCHAGPDHCVICDNDYADLCTPPIYDVDLEPSREHLEDHQVWVWMNGATPPRWEVRGTGWFYFDDKI